MVLTSDINNPNSLLADNFNSLTSNEVLAFASLRVDRES